MRRGRDSDATGEVVAARLHEDRLAIDVDFCDSRIRCGVTGIDFQRYRDLVGVAGMRRLGGERYREQPIAGARLGTPALACHEHIVGQRRRARRDGAALGGALVVAGDRQQRHVVIGLAGEGQPDRHADVGHGAHRHRHRRDAFGQKTKSTVSAPATPPN